MTLAGQMLALQLMIVLVVLVAVGAVSLAQSEATFARVEGRRVSSIAEQLAANPLVRDQLERPEVRTGLATVALATQVQANVSSISMSDPDRTVRVSTDPSLEGGRLPGAAGTGDLRAGWTGTVELDGHRHLAARVPVLRSAAGHVGEQVGAVLVTIEQPSVWERLRGASSYLLTYLGIALAAGLLGSWLLSRRVKRQTRGLEPQEIAGLAEHREAMLHSVAEGVVALDPQGRITLANDVARDLLDLPGHAVGVRVDDLRVEGRLREVLLGGTGAGATPDAVVIRRGRVLVMNTMRVERGGRLIGSVTTMRDRTDLAALEREIGSFRSASQLLRAQTHEFSNQLHTISGLIQLGELDEVVRFVDALVENRASLDLRVGTLVRDPVVAALLTAKVALANERRVTLHVADDTSLDRLEPADASDVATVVGNLIDNALDATTGSGPDAAVDVLLRQDAATVEVVVTDNGRGVDPDVLAQLFEPGVSTKTSGSDRGMGLALCRLVCRRRGGEVFLDDGHAGSGSRFVARLGVAPVPAGTEAPA